MSAVSIDPAWAAKAARTRKAQGIAKRRKRFTLAEKPPRMAKGRWRKGEGWNRGAQAKRKPQAMGDRIFHQND